MTETITRRAGRAPVMRPTDAYDLDRWDGVSRVRVWDFRNAQGVTVVRVRREDWTRDRYRHASVDVDDSVSGFTYLVPGWAGEKVRRVLAGLGEVATYHPHRLHDYGAEAYVMSGGSSEPEAEAALLGLDAVGGWVSPVPSVVVDAVMPALLALVAGAVEAAEVLPPTDWEEAEA